MTTIPATYAKHLQAFRHTTPGGHLLDADFACLIRSTARDTGKTPREVRDAMLQHWCADVPTDEAAYREAHRTGDRKALKRLEAQATARVRRVAAAMGEV